MISEAFAGRRVLVTGHTGFKGSWLALWLASAGAEVLGYALEPRTERDNYVAAGVGDKLAAARLHDVRDTQAVADFIAEHRPEVVFHLIAQPLVRYSYDNPLETISTNVMGCANVLDAVRATKCAKATVVITSDKCYRNNEWPWGYRETDTLGGPDPYSASKAAEELVVSCYRDSYFTSVGLPLASTRAGNVIGGGDWSPDRIIPDAVRALEAGAAIPVRNPSSTRPWQHVLEPLGGYLLLAARMLAEPGSYAEAFNFGPDPTNVHTVGEICDLAVQGWGSGSWEHVGHQGGHEAGLLALDSTKARTMLGWQPVLSVAESVAWTMAWYRAREDGADISALVDSQIAEYERRAASLWRPL